MQVIPLRSSFWPRTRREDEQEAPQENLERPTDDIEHASVSSDHDDNIREIEPALAITIVLAEDLLELLRDKPTFRIDCTRVGAVLSPVDAGDVDGEPRVREPGTLRWVGSVQPVECERREYREEDIEAQRTETGDGLVQVNRAVLVAIEEGDVLPSIMSSAQHVLSFGTKSKTYPLQRCKLMCSWVWCPLVEFVRVFGICGVGPTRGARARQ